MVPIHLHMAQLPGITLVQVLQRVVQSTIFLLVVQVRTLDLQENEFKGIKTLETELKCCHNNNNNITSLYVIYMELEKLLTVTELSLLKVCLLQRKFSKNLNELYLNYDYIYSEILKNTKDC